MSNNIKIAYVNRSMNRDMPKIFMFLKNETPTFDVPKEGTAWKDIENVGSSSTQKFLSNGQCIGKNALSDHTES